jgi:hypothetical protein
VQKTIIDGRVYFDRERDIAGRAELEKEKKALIDKLKKAGEKKTEEKKPDATVPVGQKPGERKPEGKKQEEKPKPPTPTPTPTLNGGAL